MKPLLLLENSVTVRRRFTAAGWIGGRVRLD
jgi:hypothetical protein